MRYDAEHKQKTRERVLQEAAKAIRAEGPHRIGVAGVMAQAGLTHGGFYAHFKSKDELVTAAIGHMFEQSVGRRIREMAGQEPLQALNAYIDFYLSAGHRDSRTSGCPMPALAADLPRLNAEAQSCFAAGVSAATASIAALLARLGHDQPEDLAASALAELVGALSLARAEPDLEHSDAMLDRSRRLLKRRLGLEGQS
jgi:TetR/AcrR family transcriptional repressor of nem operon